MKIEITKEVDTYTATFDNGDIIKTQDSGLLPSEVEAKMFANMVKEYILHYLTQDGYARPKE
jgi:hypothetical protein